MGDWIIETERLGLREMRDDDILDLAEMLKNPSVMYAYEHDFSDDDVKIWLDRQKKRYEHYGFGLWAVIAKDSDRMIGQSGLTMQLYRETEVLEVGNLFKEKFWHHGYAREAVRGCLKYAFDVLGYEKVHSIIKFDNIPSIRVAESVGMRREDEFLARYYNGDVPHFLYSINKRG